MQRDPNPDENPEIGIDHPTVVPEPRDENR